MIRSIHLNPFGKFQNSQYELSQVTVFFGENESGKSTLFDAFLQGVCKPKGTSAEGRRLTARYGSTKTVNIQWDGIAPPSPDAEEFMNLHSLKAGEIRLEFGKGKWLDEVKKNLFSGGIDPASLAESLEPLAATRANATHMKALKSLQEKEKSLETQIQTAASNKSILENSEKTLLEKEKRRLSIESEIQSAKEKIDQLVQAIGFEETIRKKKDALLDHRSLQEWKDLNQNFEKLKPFTKDDSDHYKKIQSRLQELDNQVLSLETIQAQLQTRSSEKMMDWQSRNTKREQSFRLENLARSLRERLEDSLRNPLFRSKTIWNNLHLALGSSLGILGIGAVGYDHSDPSAIFYTGLIGLVLAVGLVALARNTLMVVDETWLGDKLRNYKKEWMEAPGSPPFSETDRAEDFRDFLFQFIQSASQEQIQLDRDKLELDKFQESLESNQKEIQIRRDEQAQILEEKQNWLTSHNVANWDEYQSKIHEASHLRDRLETLEDRLRRKYPGNAFSELQLDLGRKLSVWDEQGIPDSGWNDAELQRQKATKAHWEKILENLRGEERNLGTETIRNRADLEAQIRPLSEKWISASKELVDVRAKIREITLQRKGAEIAQGIFREMSQESEDILESLSREITESSASIFGADRRIEIRSLNGEITMADAGGTNRVLDHLSLGTKDSFYITAKLALCEKRDPDLKLFIMDEPFISLDTTRTVMALQVIRSYVQEKGWQCILFTKDENLVHAVETVFAKAMVLRNDL